jgi:hypothetical protein
VDRRSRPAIRCAIIVERRFDDGEVWSTGVSRQVEEGRRRIGELSEREFLVAGITLYAGDGSKGDGWRRLREVHPTTRCATRRILLRVATALLRG